MAESNAQRATRVAYEVLEANLEALRPSAGERADQHATKDIERLVDCLIRLREAAQKQVRFSPVSAPNQPVISPDSQGPSLAKGGTEGGVVPEKKLNRKPSSTRDYKKTEYSEDFTAFWGIYPKIRRKNKPKSFSLWQALPIEIRRAAYKDVQIRSTSDQQWVDGYAPLVVTYLNGSGWEDAWESTAPGGSDSIEDRARAMATKYDEPYEKMLESLQKAEADRG
jgi:hypothetical protein